MVELIKYKKIENGEDTEIGIEGNTIFILILLILIIILIVKVITGFMYGTSIVISDSNSYKQEYLTCEQVQKFMDNCIKMNEGVWQRRYYGHCMDYYYKIVEPICFKGEKIGVKIR